ncbi:MAG: glycosyltransferase [Kiritimatiellae bacterium]|nr:glycosyltransferase [Kiritimatiellia bacterium]
MKTVHFCAGLEPWNGMANTAREFAAEESAAGREAVVTDDPAAVAPGVDTVCIHGAWLPVLWRTAKKAKKSGAKLVLRPAGSYDPVRLRYHGWKKRLAAPWERRMLARADSILATCREEAEWIRDYLGVGNDPRIVLTDLKRFFKLDGGAPQPVAGGKIRLLYLGRRHPLKGVEYLERAVAEIGAASAELRVVSDAVGDEKEKAWRWCDALALPTLSENFGRVVAEALERGKWAITTDGAPAWAPPAAEGAAAGDRSILRTGALVYVRGYRCGSACERVALLKAAIAAVPRRSAGV